MLSTECTDQQNIINVQTDVFIDFCQYTVILNLMPATHLDPFYTAQVFASIETLLLRLGLPFT